MQTNVKSSIEPGFVTMKDSKWPYESYDHTHTHTKGPEQNAQAM